MTPRKVALVPTAKTMEKSISDGKVLDFLMRFTRNQTENILCWLLIDGTLRKQTKTIKAKILQRKIILKHSTTANQSLRL